jgi:hypothetical protein
MKYILTFGRVLVLQTEIEAEDEKAAMDQALQGEWEGQLAISPITLSNPAIEVVDVQDEEEIWEVNPVQDGKEQDAMEQDV